MNHSTPRSRRQSEDQTGHVGLEAIGIDAAAGPFYGDDLPQNLRHRYGSVAHGRCIAAKNKARDITIPPLYPHDTVGDHPFLPDVEDDISHLNGRRDYGLYRDGLVRLDRGMHALSGGSKPDAFTSTQKIGAQIHE